MSQAALKINNQDWDDVKIAINSGGQPTIIVLKDRIAVEDLNTTLLHAIFDTPDESLTLTIEGIVHILEVPVWVELLDKTAEWMEEYLPATDPDYCTSEIDLESWGKIDRTNPGSDTSAQIIEFSHYQ